MPKHYYLTTGPNPKGSGLLAVITEGHHRRGDAECVVCAVEICPDAKAAQRWFKEQVMTKPWEPRQ